MPTTLLPFVWLVLPLIVWMINRFTGKRFHGMALFLIASIAGYVILLASVFLIDAEIAADLKRFEEIGDDFSPEAIRARARFSNDTGRALAPFTGIPMTAVWYGIVFGALSFGDWMIGIFTSKPSTNRVTDRNSHHETPGSATPPVDDGNPYRTPEKPG